MAPLWQFGGRTDGCGRSSQEILANGLRAGKASDLEAIEIAADNATIVAGVTIDEAVRKPLRIASQTE